MATATSQLHRLGFLIDEPTNALYGIKGRHNEEPSDQFAEAVRTCLEEEVGRWVTTRRPEYWMDGGTWFSLHKFYSTDEDGTIQMAATLLMSDSYNLLCGYLPNLSSQHLCDELVARAESSVYGL